MDTVDLLFIAAEPVEFQGAMRFWSDIRTLELPVHWARSARWKGKRIVAIANGAGPRRSAMAAAVVPFRQLVSVGFCGALDPALKIGEIVVGDGWLQPRSQSQFVHGNIVSIDHIAQTAAEKRRLRQTGAVAVEMEVGGLRGLPVFCIKSVSDLAEESFSNDLNAILQPDGRIGISKLLLNALRDPIRRFSELVRLQKRARLASNTLGEFLESCDF